MRTSSLARWQRYVVPPLAVCVMVLQPISVASAAPATGPAMAKSVPVASLPALKSTGGSKPQPTAPVGNFSNRPARGASSFDPNRSKLIDAKTTPTVAVYSNPDGSTTKQFAPYPVRFHDASGWHPIDPTLVADTTGVHAKAGRPDVLMGATSSAPVTVATVDGNLLIHHPDAASTSAQTLQGDQEISAGGLAGGRDITEQLTPSGYEESVTLHDRSQPSYELNVTMPSGVSAAQKGSDVVFSDSHGVLGSFGGGQAHDSAKPAASSPVSVGLVGVFGRVADVRVAVPTAWLGSATLPVVIDPDWVGGPIEDMLLQSVGASQFGASTLAIGTPDGTNIDRSLLRFNDDFFDGTPTAAWLDMFQTSTTHTTRVNVYGLATPFDGTTTWATQPTLDSNGLIGTADNTFGSDFNVPVITLVQAWAAGEPNNGFEVRGNDEINTSGYSTIAGVNLNGIPAPTLTVTYAQAGGIQNPLPPQRIKRATDGRADSHPNPFSTGG